MLRCGLSCPYLRHALPSRYAAQKARCCKRQDRSSGSIRATTSSDPVNDRQHRGHSKAPIGFRSALCFVTGRRNIALAILTPCVLFGSPKPYEWLALFRQPTQRRGRQSGPRPCWHVHAPFRLPRRVDRKNSQPFTPVSARMYSSAASCVAALAV